MKRRVDRKKPRNQDSSKGDLKKKKNGKKFKPKSPRPKSSKKDAVKKAGRAAQEDARKKEATSDVVKRKRKEGTERGEDASGKDQFERCRLDTFRCYCFRLEAPTYEYYEVVIMYYTVENGWKIVGLVCWTWI